MPNDTSKKTGAPKDLSVTPVDGWKIPSRQGPVDLVEDAGFVTELPSGNVVKMKRSLDLGLMLASGRIPNPLAGVVQTMIDDKATVWPKDAAADSQLNQQLLDTVRETTIACVIEPPFAGPEPRNKVRGGDGNMISETAEEYQERINAWVCPEGFINIFYVDLTDQMFIFSVAQGAAADLARFREEQKLAVADVLAGEGVLKPTKRTGGAAPRKKK